MVFWVSDPVLPDETVLLTGGGFGTNPTLHASPLPDDPPGIPFANQSDAPAPATWTAMEALQPNPRSVKFTLPASWQRGIYAARVTAGGSAGDAVLINAPDPWWMQGDQGKTATPGGWLRVFGRNLDLNGNGPAAPGIQLALMQEGRIAYALNASQGEPRTITSPATGSGPRPISAAPGPSTARTGPISTRRFPPPGDP